MSQAAQHLRDALSAHVDIFGSDDLLNGEAAGASTAGDGAPTTDSSSSVPSGNERTLTPAQPVMTDSTTPAVEALPRVQPDASSRVVAQSPYERINALIPQDSPLQGFSTLAEVESWVASTELIELDRTRTKPVFGVGNPEADLLVIGEAPGADEDREGEPFVGRAGKLLTQILQAIGFERSDVYIANILKSRPDNNRDPRPDEIAAHVPILYKQMVLIQPKLILCVGKTSGNSLLGGKQSLKSMRGTFQDFHGLEVLVTYHPAALLRNPNWKRPTWEDVQLLGKRHDELQTS